ncbi:MAG: hypothetical protein ACLRS8_19725 [Parabacteroides merdae]
MSYSNLSVSQIAYESGYGNVPYFIKQFESITRQTPKGVSYFSFARFGEPDKK